MGWQPIESAPKDGTRIDLWMVRLSTSGHRRKSHDERRAPDCYWCEKTERWRSRWRDGDGYPAVGKHYEATHWMPIAFAPAEVEHRQLLADLQLA